ncbi:MAG: hypothetical protein J6S60_10325 [Oscillospiraceae bacterium]|nr:hypothetical protein [Oscillospiraceae bacterium]
MKNPSIKEGGIARIFGGIKKLFTRQSGGDALIAWVPESERNLGTKHITKNGVYKASDDGYYAYSSVTVNVSTDTGVTGAEDDGEQHYVRPNAETGELVDTLVPSSIQVVTPPTFTGPYGDGAYIGFDGMVVKAFLASGEVWEDAGHPGGVIPFNELVFPVTVAEYNPDAPSEYGRSTSSILPSGGYVPIYSEAVCNYQLNNPTKNYSHNLGIVGVGTTGGLFKPSNNNYQLIFASAKREEITYIRKTLYIDVNGDTKINETVAPTLNMGDSYTHDGKKVYYAYASVPGNSTIAGVNTIPTYDAPIMNVGRGEIAWTMVYGSTEITGGTPIPVNWSRPGDGVILEDAFAITVVDITPGGHGED